MSVFYVYQYASAFSEWQCDYQMLIIIIITDTFSKDLILWIVRSP